MIKNYKNISPVIAKSVFVAQTAVVVGDVVLKENSNIWYNTVLRGDVNKITIGKNTNIQDLTMIHTASDYETIVGDYVTVGHNAILHGCTIGDNCLIGMGSIILDGAIIEDNVIIGAGALVPQGKRIPKNSLVLGSPGKVVRQLSDEEIQMLKEQAEGYVRLAKEY